MKKQEYRPVGMWYRLLAYLLDGVFVSIISLPLAVPMFIIIFSAASKMFEGGYDVPQYSRAQYLALGFLSLGSVLVNILYHSILTASKLEGTFAKKLLGIKVVRLDGNRLNYSSSLLRYLVLTNVSVFIAVFNYSQSPGLRVTVGLLSLVGTFFTVADALIGANDQQKRTIHDRLSGSRVVYRSNP